MEKLEFRILVVDDHEPFRQFVLSKLRQRPEWQIVGEASDGLEAVHKAKELQPDLILLDLGLPTMNGIEAAQRIRNFAHESKILISEPRIFSRCGARSSKLGSAGLR